MAWSVPGTKFTVVIWVLKQLMWNEERKVSELAWAYFSGPGK